MAVTGVTTFAFCHMAILTTQEGCGLCPCRPLRAGHIASHPHTILLVGDQTTRNFFPTHPLLFFNFGIKILFSESQLQLLKSDLRVTQSKAYAAGTLRHVTSAWSSFKAFCSYFNFPSLPATEEVVALYIECLSRSGLAVGTVKNHVTGIRLVHKLKNLQPPDLTDLDIVLVLKGLSVDRGLRLRQAAPITPQILLSFYNFLDLTTPVGCSWWALFLAAWYLMARASNLTPQSRDSFDPLQQLSWGAISLSDSVIFVKILWTKTLQYRERELIIPLMAVPGSRLCPVAAFWRLAQFGRRNKQGAVFCDAQGFPFVYGAFLNKIKALAVQSGLNPAEFSTHSFRRGGATFAFQAGVPLQLIQVQGDWASLSILRYFQYPVEARALVGAKMGRLVSDMGI